MVSMTSKSLLLFSLLVGVHGAVTPQQVYDGTSAPPVLLRIGNGGAGQSGLIEELADRFIQDMMLLHKEKKFRVAWVRSDTTETINYLKSGDVDVGITYNANAEELAIEQDIVEKNDRHYLFRDHFLITGPEENPAKLRHCLSAALVPIADTKCMGAKEIFQKLYESAENGENEGGTFTRFLSRYDKSATNIKESELWVGIGQVPWANATSEWYHMKSEYPVQALEDAIKLKEYTLTDKGTYLTLDPKLAKQVKIYGIGKDHENDLLLNPASLLIGKRAKTKVMVQRFANWAISCSGQDVIKSFQKEGKKLYTGAPGECKEYPGSSSAGASQYPLELRDIEDDLDDIYESLGLK